MKRRSRQEQSKRNEESLHEIFKRFTKCVSKMAAKYQAKVRIAEKEFYLHLKENQKNLDELKKLDLSDTPTENDLGCTKAQTLRKEIANNQLFMNSLEAEINTYEMIEDMLSEELQPVYQHFIRALVTFHHTTELGTQVDVD